MKSNEPLNVFYLLRVAKNISAKDLSESLGITTAYISAIENGKRYPSQRLLRDYAKALDVDIDVLKTFAPPKNSNKFEDALLKLLKMISDIDE